MLWRKDGSCTVYLGEGIPELCYRRDSHVGPKHRADVLELL